MLRDGAEKGLWADSLTVAVLSSCMSVQTRIEFRQLESTKIKFTKVPPNN
jgi:hypothetical protein